VVELTMAALLLLLLALPVVELVVLIQVAGTIGFLDTVGLLIVVSLVGAWLAKRVGAGVVRRIQRAVAAGQAPDREVVDGALVLLAGVLLILPGFVSDAIGIALLLPPVRAGVRTLILRRLARRQHLVVVGGRRGQSTPTGQTGVWDVESWEDQPSSPRREIGGEEP
jgi:UPF0716 protein FxsA